MQIISNVALISINETLVIQLISFLIFLYIINRTMFRPLLKAMSDRETYIENLKKEVADSDQEMQDLNRQMEMRGDQIRSEAFQTVGQMHADGNEKAAKVLSSARNEIERIKAEAQNNINSQIQSARQTLEQNAETLCVHIMEKILERKVAQ